MDLLDGRPPPRLQHDPVAHCDAGLLKDANVHTPPDWNLERFVTAQNPVYADVCAELAAGRKRTHWMWFVFPQLKALGRSSTARFFGLDGAAEAAAYWQHPVLGERLRVCARMVLDVPGTDAHRFFGSPDDLKLCSCMTLFEIVAPEEPVFGEVLERYFDGVRDSATLALVRD